VTCKAPRGTRDILPDESRSWCWIEQQARRVGRRYGYLEIRTPVFEHTELFSRLGEATEIVQKEMYTFKDRGDRSLTLRPEGTAPVCRAFLEHHLGDGALPVKVFYLSPMLRYERPQSGRLRQHHQFGVEALGSLDPAVDVEVITLALDFYRSLGLKGLRLHLNSLGCPECRPRYREALLGFFSARRSNLCDDCLERLERNVLRVLDCKVEACRRQVRGAPAMADYLCGECEAHFSSLRRMLDGLGIPNEVDPCLVRGMDYYTKTIFEIFSRALGEDTALGGGGRYDGLIEELGGPPTPGIGFGLGLERLLLALEAQGCRLPGPEGLDAFIATVGDEDGRRRAVEVLYGLRRAGLAADMDYGGRSLKGQMKHANRIGARRVVIAGGDELARGLVTVRDMETGRQEEVPVPAIAEYILKATRQDVMG